MHLRILEVRQCNRPLSIEEPSIDDISIIARLVWELE